MKKIGPTNVASNTFVPESSLCQNILNKFMDQKSADVAFEVGGGNLQAKTNLTSKRAKTSTTTLHAHRLILQDGAPMLAELYKPGGEGLPTVSIPDVKPDIFHHMLYYTYGGGVPDNDLMSNAQDLIDAADKFGIVNLKLKAEACYVKSTTLTINNVLDNICYTDSKIAHF